MQIAVSQDMPVDEHDISALLGNLLENAVDACITQENERRRIVVKGDGDSHSLVFTIDNTIVERYNGFFSADAKEDMFCVSFMLNL